LSSSTSSSSSCPSASSSSSSSPSSSSVSRNVDYYYPAVLEYQKLRLLQLFGCSLDFIELDLTDIPKTQTLLREVVHKAFVVPRGDLTQIHLG